MADLMFQGQNWERLIAGWPERPGNLWFTGWRDAVTGAQAAVVDLGLTVREMRAEGRLTEQGLRDAAADLVTKLLRPRLVALRDAVREMDERSAAIREQAARTAAPGTVNPTEIQVRSEIRYHVRNLDMPQRMAFLAEHTDPATVAAVMEAPGYLTGVTTEQRNALVAGLLTDEQRSIIADIEAARQVADVTLRGALAVAENHLDMAGRTALRVALYGERARDMVVTPEAAAAQAGEVVDA